MPLSINQFVAKVFCPTSRIAAKSQAVFIIDFSVTFYDMLRIEENQ